MRTPRSLRIASAIVLAALLGSCDGSGGTQTVFFSMYNYQGCATAYVRIDLRSADSEIARTDEGELDCVLVPELAGRGCTLIFRELDDGWIEAEVDGCRVQVESDLFSCNFTRVDFAALNAGQGRDSTCGCLAYEDSCYVNGVCDVCASREAGRQLCERCGNNLDDDYDDEVDCDDPDCELNEECGYGRSTITCTHGPSTSTTSTTLTSTTNAFPPPLASMTELFGSRD
jgi:hypothetical protein